MLKCIHVIDRNNYLKVVLNRFPSVFTCVAPYMSNYKQVVVINIQIIDH